MYFWIHFLKEKAPLTSSRRQNDVTLLKPSSRRAPADRLRPGGAFALSQRRARALQAEPRLGTQRSPELRGRRAGQRGRVDSATTEPKEDAREAHRDTKKLVGQLGWAESGRSGLWAAALGWRAAAFRCGGVAAVEGRLARRKTGSHELWATDRGRQGPPELLPQLAGARRLRGRRRRS